MTDASKKYLISIIKKYSQKMEPVYTGVKAKYSPLEGIKAVLFDIYGTLFISEAGDISHAEVYEKKNNGKDKTERSIFQKTFEDAGIDTSDFNTALYPELHDFYVSEIKKEHKKLISSGIKHPEVVITEIWERILKNLTDRHFTEDEIFTTASVYESLSNRTYPMPEAENVLAGLKRREVILGIISNAQFYTPLMFNAYFGKSTEEIGFDNELSIYSFKYRQSKPDSFLFEKAAGILEKKYNIKPQQVLYTGNDMLNDITAAYNAGMKTALFAGDKRSLRLRENTPACRGISPDRIITDLGQICDIIF